MFTNYLKVALRNIIRHKGHTVINITGLAVGMALWIALFAAAGGQAFIYFQF